MDDRFEPGGGCVGPAFLNTDGHELLEHGPEAGDLLEVTGSELRDAGSTARLTGDQTLFSETGEGFAYRDVADAEGMWLPTIVKSMGDFSNSTIGWLVAVPNICAALVMLPWVRPARKQGNIPLQIGITLSITALSLIAAVAAQGTPVLALAALCVGMSAFFSTTPLFWSLPPMVLTGAAAAAAAGLAFINSIGNLAGFAGPYAIGWISETTGSAIWGLLLIAALTLLGAGVAFT